MPRTLSMSVSTCVCSGVRMLLDDAHTRSPEQRAPPTSPPPMHGWRASAAVRLPRSQQKTRAPGTVVRTICPRFSIEGLAQRLVMPGTITTGSGGGGGDGRDDDDRGDVAAFAATSSAAAAVEDAASDENAMLGAKVRGGASVYSKDRRAGPGSHGAGAHSSSSASRAGPANGRSAAAGAGGGAAASAAVRWAAPRGVGGDEAIGEEQPAERRPVAARRPRRAADLLQIVRVRARHPVRHRVVDDEARAARVALVGAEERGEESLFDGGGASRPPTKFWPLSASSTSAHRDVPPPNAAPRAASAGGSVHTISPSETTARTRAAAGPKRHRACSAAHG